MASLVRPVLRRGRNAFLFRPTITISFRSFGAKPETTSAPNVTTTADTKNGTPTTKAAAASETATTTTAAADDLLKAPFTKIQPPSKAVFPWRSSPLLLDRLLPDTEEYYRKGLLLGGDLTSSNPRLDGFATAVFFLRIPLWDMLLFRASTEQDLANNMAWAFERAVTELVSCNEGSNENENGNKRLHDMLESKRLAKLFESSREFGKDSLKVRLEVEAITAENHSEMAASMPDTIENVVEGPKIVSLFVFPFLSRSMLEDPYWKGHIRKYHKLIDAMKDNPNDVLPNESMAQLSREFMDEFSSQKECENTIICQVLVPCKETFWVRDAKTNTLLQGSEEPLLVHHLVRFEQVTKTRLVPNKSFLPFHHEPGEWIITDIDDLCDGNTLL